MIIIISNREIKFVVLIELQLFAYFKWKSLEFLSIFEILPPPLKLCNILADFTTFKHLFSILFDRNFPWHSSCCSLFLLIPSSSLLLFVSNNILFKSHLSLFSVRQLSCSCSNKIAANTIFYNARLDEVVGNRKSRDCFMMYWFARPFSRDFLA